METEVTLLITVDEGESVQEETVQWDTQDQSGDGDAPNRASDFEEVGVVGVDLSPRYYKQGLCRRQLDSVDIFLKFFGSREVHTVSPTPTSVITTRERNASESGL